MLAHVLAHARPGLSPLVVGGGVAIGGDGFERKLGVDHQRPLVWQEDYAIRPHAVAERELKLVAILRQAVADDDFHAALTEGAALLLVGQDVLQRRHLAGQRRDVFLRPVDDGKPLMQLLQVLGGALRGLVQRIAKPVRDRIEPLVDEMLQLRLALRQQPDHRLHAHGGIGLGIGQLAHGGGVGVGKIAGHGARSPCHHGHDHKHDRGGGSDAKHRGRRQAGNDRDLQMIEQRLGLGHFLNFTRFAGSEQTANTVRRGTGHGAGRYRGLTAVYARLTSPHMALREIIILPDKRLRLKSEPIKRIDATIRKLVNDLFETMYEAPGIGLAAIQIGVPKRVVTMDLSKKEDDHKLKSSSIRR